MTFISLIDFCDGISFCKTCKNYENAYCLKGMLQFHKSGRNLIQLVNLIFLVIMYLFLLFKTLH